MLVSVIIPFLNDHTCLPNCLISLRENLGIEHEIILIDDANKDTTYLETLQEPPSKTLFNTRRMGPAHARNMGIKEASGDFILFMDSDDRIVSSLAPLFDALFELQGDTPDIDLLIGERLDARLPTSLKKIPNGIANIQSHPNMVRIEGFTSTLYRRNFLLDNDIRFDANHQISEDTVFQAACISKARNTLLRSIPFYSYEKRKQSRSQSQLDAGKAQSRLVVMDDITTCYENFREAKSLCNVILFSRNHLFYKRVKNELSRQHAEEYYEALGEWARRHLFDTNETARILENYYINWNSSKANLLSALLEERSGQFIRDSFFKD